MAGTARWLGALAIAASLLAGACASTAGTDQMRIGLWAARQNLWDEAIFRWRQALTARPESAAVHNNLAVAYEVKGQWEDARREYEAALKLAPRDSRIKLNYEQFKRNLAPSGGTKPEPSRTTVDEKKT